MAAASLMGLAPPRVASTSKAEPSQAARDPVIMAAGDIACDPADPSYNEGAGTSTRCHQRATSDLLVGAAVAAVLPLGDLQYQGASLSNIMAVYDPTWGRVKSISRPVLGNREDSGAGFFDYFNGPGVMDGPAGVRGKGYYSFDIGSWHLVALNSNCTQIGCSAGSEQERWLRADLAAHRTRCTLAYWHHPRWSSGEHGSNSSMQPLWEALEDAGAEIVLSGHRHHYERFSPLDGNGASDPADGIRQFVVGTGGAFFTDIGSTIAHSEVAQNDTFGVLKLTLHPMSYDWEFVPEAGKTFTDSGSAACHEAPIAAPRDRVAPVISRLALSPRRFVADRGESTQATNSARQGTTFRYRLSEAATVRFTIRRRSKGRQVAGRCRAQTRDNLARQPCVRHTRVGRFTQVGVAGANRRRFRGRIGRRQLRPGAFRADLKATDARGNRSQPESASFTIVAPAAVPRAARHWVHAAAGGRTRPRSPAMSARSP
jgi:acid phosphatase type 7